MTHTPPPPPGEPGTGEQPLGALEGIRAWLAQLDRRIRASTYAGAALIIVALATSAAAIVLGINAGDDAATQREVNDLRTKITDVEQSAVRAAAEDVAAFGNQVEELEQSIRDLRQAIGRNRSEIRVGGDDIEDLRGQLSDLTERVAELESGRSGGG